MRRGTRRRYWIHVVLLVLVVPILGCAEKPGTVVTPVDAVNQLPVFSCDAEHVGRDQCVYGVVQSCNANTTLSPGFLVGQRCAQMSLACAVDEATHQAACIDPKADCTNDEPLCDDNQAINCLDGKRSPEPCGFLRRCKVDTAADRAYCEDTADVAYPERSCDLFENRKTLRDKTPTKTFSQAFDASHQIKLYQPTMLTLPKNSVSYVSFVVDHVNATEHTRTFIVSLDGAGVFEAVVDEDENVIAESGTSTETPCPALLMEQHEHGLLYDGAPTPYVIRFTNTAVDEEGDPVDQPVTVVVTQAFTSLDVGCERLDIAAHTYMGTFADPDPFVTGPIGGVTALKGRYSLYSDNLTEITLPTGKSYVNFTIYGDGDYLLFMDKAGFVSSVFRPNVKVTIDGDTETREVLDWVDYADQITVNPITNDYCPNLVKENIAASLDLVNSFAGADGETYVLEFDNGGAEETTLNLYLSL